MSSRPNDDNNDGVLGKNESLMSLACPKPRIDVSERNKYQEPPMNSLGMNNARNDIFQSQNNAFLQSQSQGLQGTFETNFNFKGNPSIDKPLGDTQTFGLHGAFNNESQNQGNGIFDSSLTNQLPGKLTSVGAALSQPGSGSVNRINVTFEFEDAGQKTMFKQQKIEKDNHGNIMLAPLIENIKDQGFCIRNHVVSYFSQTDRAYVFVAKDPIPDDYIIMMSDLDRNNPVLQIKLRPMGDSPTMVNKKGKLGSFSGDNGFNSFNIQPNAIGHTDEPQRFTSIVQRQDDADRMQPQDKMGDVPRLNSDEVRKESDRKMMEHLRGQLPITVSQNVREIDQITKPNELQKQHHNQKMQEGGSQNYNPPPVNRPQNSIGISIAGDRCDSESNKMGISTRSKAIGKAPRGLGQQIDDGGSDQGGMMLAGRESKRTKERSIEEIIQKVSLWRKLYNGVLRDGNLVRYSLEDAASKVNVSKKSLDDYLLQLRFGKKYGFNFQEHKNDKVGVLRSFVKSKKNEAKKSGNKIKETSMIENVNKSGGPGNK